MGEYFSVCLHAVIRGDPPNILIFSPSLEGEEASSLTARSFLTHPLADIVHPPYPTIASQSISRDVPGAQARPSDSLYLFWGVAKAALYCAHRTSTFLSCAFCEQEGHLAALLYPSEGARCASKMEQPPCPPLTSYGIMPPSWRRAWHICLNTPVPCISILDRTAGIRLPCI